MCWDCYNNPVDPYTERNAYREEDESPTRHRKAGKGKKSSPNVKGCPASGGKAHVYVWVQFNGIRLTPVWYGTREAGDRHCRMEKRPVTWWERLCIGCDHRNNRKYSWGPPPQSVYEVRKVDHDIW